jgi:hypothetical protein
MEIDRTENEKEREEDNLAGQKQLGSLEWKAQIQMQEHSPLQTLEILQIHAFKEANSIIYIF